MSNDYVIEVLNAEETRLLERLASVREAIGELTVVEPMARVTEIRTVKELIIEVLSNSCLTSEEVWQVVKTQRPGISKKLTDSRLSQLAKKGLVRKMTGLLAGVWTLSEKGKK